MIKSSTEIEFASSDGVRLFGTQVLPVRSVGALVLFVHGITSDRAEWGLFEKAAEEFAAIGCASLRFDYRGHGKSYLPSTEITLEGIKRDVVAAWTRLQPVAPDGNCYILGSSFGGGLAYNAASMIGGFSRAFLLAPVFDYALDIKKTAPKWKRDIGESGFIQYSNLRLDPSILLEAETFQSISSDAKLRATIFHGSVDDDVPISSSRLAAKLHSFFELVEIEGAGHVISAPGDIDMESEQSWQFVAGVLAQIVDRMKTGA